MMRFAPLCVVLWLLIVPAFSVAQEVQHLNDILPPHDYENVYVHKLSTDQHSTSFVIWVRQSVKAHKHEHHSETLYVLEGYAKMELDGREIAIEPGDFIFIPTGTVHSVIVTSSEVLKVLSVQAPEFLGKDRIFVD